MKILSIFGVLVMTSGINPALAGNYASMNEFKSKMLAASDFQKACDGQRNDSDRKYTRKIVIGDNMTVSLKALNDKEVTDNFLKDKIVKTMVYDGITFEMNKYQRKKTFANTKREDNIISQSATVDKTSSANVNASYSAYGASIGVQYYVSESNQWTDTSTNSSGSESTLEEVFTWSLIQKPYKVEYYRQDYAYKDTASLRIDYEITGYEIGITCEYFKKTPVFSGTKKQKEKQREEWRASGKSRTAKNITFNGGRDILGKNRHTIKTDVNFDIKYSDKFAVAKITELE